MPSCHVTSGRAWRSFCVVLFVVVSGVEAVGVLTRHRPRDEALSDPQPRSWAWQPVRTADCDGLIQWIARPSAGLPKEGGTLCRPNCMPLTHLSHGLAALQLLYQWFPSHVHSGHINYGQAPNKLAQLFVNTNVTRPCLLGSDDGQISG
jgi:hypothetical protein